MVFLRMLPKSVRTNGSLIESEGEQDAIIQVYNNQREKDRNHRGNKIQTQVARIATKRDKGDDHEDDNNSPYTKEKCQPRKQEITSKISRL